MEYKKLKAVLLTLLLFPYPAHADDGQNVDMYLKSYAQEYAFIFFTKTGCSYCEDQKRILKTFTQNIPWNIKEVNISNRPDIGNRFDIEVTPTLVLIAKSTDKFVQLTEGVQSSGIIKRSAVKGIDLLKKSRPRKEMYLMKMPGQGVKGRMYRI